MIAKYEEHTVEWKNLAAVAKMLEALSENDASYYVGDTWFDYGQGWEWTTIIRAQKGTIYDVQILSPKKHEMVIEAKSASDLAKAVDAIRNDEYFNE